MDDEEIMVVRINAQTHDRWSLLVIATHWVSSILKATANTSEVLLATAMEHAAQKEYDKRFKEIVK